MGKKGPMPTYKTMDDYIINQPLEAQRILNEIRKIINDTVPGVIELLNYKVPSFTLVPGGKVEQQIMMSGNSKFVGFYPFPETMEAFASELTDYKCGKGSIQFPFNKPLPIDIIVRMVKHRKEAFLKEA